MYLVFAIWNFVTVTTKWNGDVTRMLLLRLLDEQEKGKDDAT